MQEVPRPFATPTTVAGALSWRRALCLALPLWPLDLGTGFERALFVYWGGGESDHSVDMLYGT